MMPSQLALYLSCLLMAHMAALTVSSSLRFASVNIGEDVTLECFYEDNADITMLYWYKQSFGQKPEMVSKFFKYDKYATLMGEFKSNSRLEVETAPGKNHLKISYVQTSDAATYYCISGYSYIFKFMEGILVSVKGSGLSVPALVQQAESIQPGGSVTLDCTVHTGTCDGEHSVYWFRDAEESHPGLIYTHGGSNDQCERKPNTQTHTCVYNLPLKSLNLSQAGTYYCAVVSCGHILFGDGTKLDVEDEEHCPALVNFLSGALIFTIVLVVLLACAGYATYKQMNHCRCTDHQTRSSATPTPNVEGYQDADGLHYAALREHRVNRSTRQRDSTEGDCVYSSVKH